MKARLILLILLLSTQVNSQAHLNLVDSLKSRIDSLEQRLERENYTRIPKKDFENLISNEIRSNVQNSIYWWIAALFSLVAGGGFLIGAYNRAQINEKILDIQTRLFNDASKAIDEKVNTSLGFLWNGVADGLIEKAEEKKYISQEVIIGIEQFLNIKNNPILQDKKIKLIDTLMRCYYWTNRPDKNKKMVDLLNRFGKEHTLLPETYANASIALCNNYEYYGMKSDLDLCVDACEKSIQILPDYGTAYAVKLEVLSISSVKAYDDKEKQTALENIRRTFKTISNNQSPYLCKELITRLEGDKKVAYLKSYILQLEQLFPNEMSEILKRSA